MKRNRNGVIALDANILLIEIIKHGLTVEDISKLLKISRVATYRKLKDIKLLTIGEALFLKDVLKLSDQEAAAIFLGAWVRMQTIKYKNATIHIRGEVDKEKLKNASIQFLKKAYTYKKVGAKRNA